MLLGLASDLARIPGCHVATLWDERLGPFPRRDVRARIVSGPDQQTQLFRELAAHNDVTLVIAPECGHILADLRRKVDEAGGSFLGPSQSAIELCSDKLAVATHLRRAATGSPNDPAPCRLDVWTVATSVWEPQSLEPRFPYPIVVKPRDGAGAQDTFLVSTAAEYENLRRRLLNREGSQPFIQQPYVVGQHSSTAALISSNGRHIEVFPVGMQKLEIARSIKYAGGRVPADLEPPIGRAVQHLVRQVCESIPGLSGYVGFDVIVPQEPPLQPLVVDINPRLTTSYLGYRSLTDDNIAARLLQTEGPYSAIPWKKTAVDFDTRGHIGA